MSISEADLDLSGLGIYNSNSKSTESEYSSHPETEAANAFTRFKGPNHLLL